MAFYRFHQNNSGGAFTEPALNVYIEADSAKEANRIAEEKGIYFNGCHSGLDCDCCGDRWSEAWDEERTFTLAEAEADNASDIYARWAERDEVPYKLVIRKQGGAVDTMTALRELVDAADDLNIYHGAEVPESVREAYNEALERARKASK